MKKSITNLNKRDRRRGKIRAKISGTKECPRLSIFRSNQYIYGQIIDDEHGKTLVSASDSNVKGKKGAKTKATKTKSESAKEAGLLIAKEAVAKKIKKVVFDRGGFSYTGRVKAFADGAREGGLVF